MKNININLTPQQAELVDKTAQKHGFANRSEFFRSLLRYVFFYSPNILAELDAVAFEEPPTKNIHSIISDLKKSGKYNRHFIESVAEGLKQSDYFGK